MTEHKKSIKIKIPKLNIWLILTILLSITLLAVLATCFTFSGSRHQLTPEQAAKKAIEWIENYFKTSGVDVNVEFISASETPGGVYEFKVKLTSSSGSQEDIYYVSKDGELFFPQGIPTKVIQTTQTTQPAQTGAPKSDKPDAKLFTMSYCPYGLQAIKAMLPVMNLLGDKASITINFVDYIMHGEKEVYENLRQYCIQKEQHSKLYAYLLCFVQSDDYGKCLNDAGVDKSKLDKCMDDTDKAYNITNLLKDKSTWLNGYYPQFPIESDLNDLYDVRGSPTLVINGKTVSVARSPEAYKQAICNAFNNPPSECNTQMSSQVTAPGVGPITSTSGSSSGYCG